MLFLGWLVPVLNKFLGMKPSAESGGSEREKLERSQDVCPLSLCQTSLSTHSNCHGLLLIR